MVLKLTIILKHSTDLFSNKAGQVSVSLTIILITTSSTSMVILDILCLLCVCHCVSGSCPYDQCLSSDGSCLPIYDSSYTLVRKECDGSCLALATPCHGKCDLGQCKVGETCQACNYRQIIIINRSALGKF